MKPRRRLTCSEKKEESSDYRYFPEPDLVPVTTTAPEIERVRASLGELPAALRPRLESNLRHRTLRERGAREPGPGPGGLLHRTGGPSRDGKLAGNWVQQDVLRTLNEQQIDIEQFPLRPKPLAELIETVRKGRADHRAGPLSLRQDVAGGKSLDETMQAMGIAAVDESRIGKPLPRTAGRQSQGRRRSQGRQAQGPGQLIGQAKKKNPNVNPNRFRELCEELIRYRYCLGRIE